MKGRFSVVAQEWSAVSRAFLPVGCPNTFVTRL